MEVPGELTCRNRVRTLFTVGEGSPSSSESPVPSALGIRSPSVPETGFRREVEVYARSGPAGGSGGHEKGCSDSCRDAARDAARDVEGVALEVVGATSNIMHFGGEESVRGLSLFRNPPLALGYAAGLGCATCPECVLCQESGEPETDLFQISRIRYSSAWPAKSEPTPVLFQN